ncbi:MAG: NAD+ synthase [Opitutaceae bacterium]
MRLGLAQINPTVGDLAGNRRLILEAYAALVAQGAELVVFPELATCGYPPRDLLFRRGFVPDVAASLAAISAEVGAVPALVGTVEPNPTGAGRPCFNSAALCRNGRVEAMARKCLLPTYDVFDEDRYFEAAAAPLVITHAGRRIGVTLCEDIWTNPQLGPRRYAGPLPLEHLAGERCDLMVNLSASPWCVGKEDVRRRIVVADAARRLGCPVAYVNAVGGNDELIFDGRSLLADAAGRTLASLAAFREELRVITLPPPGLAAPEDAPPPAEAAADLFAALVLGLRDYAHKSGFRRALIALSGGIDSAVVGVIAAAAFGPENVTGVALPSAISSAHSLTDARELAANLGIRCATIPIAGIVAEAEAALAPTFTGRAPDVTEENLQARTRGLLMMALSNKFSALLLTTGNKSEMAVGYCTLYGDMCGGLAVISDVYKTQVYALARWINREREIIPRSSIEKPPSAELRPGQLDQDSLPPYDTLDALLAGYVEEGLSRRELVARGFPEPTVRDVTRKVDASEYKRKQAAPGLKVTPLAFGVGRRIPIVHRYAG